MAVCPKCGGQNFQYELRSAGTYSQANYYRTGVKNSWIIPAGRKTRRSYRKQQTVGFCRDCGYVENKQEQAQGCAYLLIAAVLLVLLIGSSISSCVSQIAPKSTTLHQNEASSALSDEIWQRDITDLSEFDYYIEDGTIILTSYNGQQSKIKIASMYDVDGEKMQVIALEGTFALKSIKSVIVPNGVTQITSNTFNSCGVKYLYFPASLIDFNGWSYLHDVEKIYYGGNKGQWDALSSGNWNSVNIACDVNISTLTK